MHNHVQSHLLCQGVALAIFFIFALPRLVQAQSSDDAVPFFTSDQLGLDIMSLMPVRAEYEELYYDSLGQRSMSGYILLEVDQAHMWGNPTMHISWKRQSWAATGSDVVVVDSNFAVLSRHLPGLNGLILEAHNQGKDGKRVDVLYTNPSALADSNTTYLDTRTKESRAFNRPYSYTKTHKNTHNIIVWPYLIAAHDWEAHPDIILPGFNALGFAEYYYRMTDRGWLNLTDLNGYPHRVRVVEGVRRATLEEVRNVRPEDQASRSLFYVSTEAPYYFGRKVYRLQTDGSETLTSTEVLVDFERFHLSHRARMEAMITEGRPRLAQFDIPWLRSAWYQALRKKITDTE